MGEDRVEDGEQFMHAGGERHLLRLASGDEPVMEGLNHGIEAGADQGCHVEDGTDS